MRRSKRDPGLIVPYGHPGTWRGGGVRPGAPTHRHAVQRLLGGSLGPGYVLGVDQAAMSGYAVVELDQRRVVATGTARTSPERRRALIDLRKLPGFDPRRMLVAFEDHTTFPFQSTTQAVGLGVALGRWLELLDIFDHPPRLRIKAAPQEWRRVLGTTGALERDAWKAQARAWATSVCRRRIASDDEAEAVCIATWGAWDGLHQWSVKVEGVAA